MNSPLRVVFFGAPSYAIPALTRLAESSEFEVSLVVTQPDRPAGRGRRLTPPAVKTAAESLGLPVHQPESLRSDEARAPLVNADADLFVVAAFGLIFGPKTLATPRLGCVNLHASLLPAYRGASPITAAILEGDDETGVTLMLMERGLDTGPMIAASAIPILPSDTTETLTERLAVVGADLAIETIPKYADGEIAPVPQSRLGASEVRPLTKADGQIDWTMPATVIERHVRAMWPWPRAWSVLDDEPVQIHAATLGPACDGPAGVVVERDADALVRCGTGSLRLDLVQASGGKPISGRQWLSRRRHHHPMSFQPVIAGRPPIVRRLD